MNTNLTKKLSGKVALVTGGSRGIGAAIAKRLAADGAAVALTYSALPAKADEVVRSIETAGGKALAIKADAADTEAVRLAVAKTVGTFGGIDILVNNAGVGIIAPIEQFALADFEKLIAVNVRGLFVATQEAARHMREGSHHSHWQHQQRAHALCRWFGLCTHEGSGCRFHEGTGPRPRPARHYREQRSARSD
jgi:3-oxoacyl-[acyl-carrier protein] reductase